MSLPQADELFRPTVVPDPGAAADEAAPVAAEQVPPEPKGPSGRVKHDEKMTVYITSDELLDIEHARLALRRLHGMAVDRGRLVRTAVALALADLDEQGDESNLVQRLRD